VWQRPAAASGPVTPVASTPIPSAAAPAATADADTAAVSQVSERELVALEETKNSLKQLQEEFTVYRREKSENERWHNRRHCDVFVVRR